METAQERGSKGKTIQGLASKRGQKAKLYGDWPRGGSKSKSIQRLASRGGHPPIQQKINGELKNFLDIEHLASSTKHMYCASSQA